MLRARGPHGAPAPPPPTRLRRTRSRRDAVAGAQGAPQKTEAEHSHIGKPAVRVDAEDIAHGQETLGANYRVPDMATAVVVRCPWLGGGVNAIANTPDNEPGFIAEPCSQRQSWQLTLGSTASRSFGDA